MSEMFNPSAAATAFDHNTTVVAVLELSGKNWLFRRRRSGRDEARKAKF